MTDKVVNIAVANTSQSHNLHLNGQKYLGKEIQKAKCEQSNFHIQFG